jgi:hypothetical protein
MPTLLKQITTLLNKTVSAVKSTVKDISSKKSSPPQVNVPPTTPTSSNFPPPTERPTPKERTGE